MSKTAPFRRCLDASRGEAKRNRLGQENAADLATPIYTVPTLAEYFDDNTVAWGTIEVADEYSDDFSSSADLDLSSGLPLPAAEYSDGFVQASFDFPGEFTTQDFLLNTGYSEIFTNSQTFFTDSNNTTFTVQNGVLNVRKFTGYEVSVERAAA